MDTDAKATVQKLLVSVPDYIQKVQCDTDKTTLPFKCAVVTCQNVFLSLHERETYPYKFHNFPTNEDLCKIWKKNCGLQENHNVKLVKICSEHFSLDDYVRNYKEEFTNPDFKRTLKQNAIPQKNIPSIENTEIKIEKTYHILDFKQIKEAVDENVRLKKKCFSQAQKRKELDQKLAELEAEIRNKTNKINKAKKALEKIDLKGTAKGKMVSNCLEKVFTPAQIQLLMGKKVFWSDDDLARAFTLRHMGGKELYLYLRNTVNLPLPSLSCVQRWMSSKPE